MTKKTDSNGSPRPRELFCRTQRQLAWNLGIRDETVNRWCKAGLPRHPTKGYSVRSASKWRAANLASEGNRSEGLEKYRAARARTAEVEAREREGETVSVASIQHVLTAFASRLGELGEHCRKEYGEGIVDLFNEKVRDAIRELGLLDPAEHPSDGPGDPGAPGAK